VEFGHQAVNGGGSGHSVALNCQITLRSSSTFACGRIVRISKIEIIGRNLRNRNNSVRNSPIVPMKVDQSQIVGLYLPHAEGRKSRCRLVTTMMNRSSHMPTFTRSEMPKRIRTLVRTRLNQ